MATMFEAITTWYWSESFWLPANVTWKHFKSTKDITMPQPHDLKIVPPLVLLLLIIRVLFERFVAYPFAKLVGVPDEKRKVAEPNKILERVFTTITKSPDAERTKGLAKELQWTEKKVRKWFYLCRNARRPTIMKKATECSWRFLFYFCSFYYGLYILHKEKHFFDTKHLWYNYPHYDVNKAVFFYYVIQVSFYISLICSQFLDTRRKDFWPMFIHHNATIVLILMSYITNHIRVGCIIMLVHDSADYLLEAAKVFNYGKMQRTCDTLFVFFAIVFFVSRLVIYPGWVLNTVAFEAREIVGHFNSWYPFITLLSLLQILHLFWGFFVGRVVYSSLVSGKVDRDSRSDSEESADDLEDDDQKAPEQNSTVVQNGKKRQ